MNLLRLKTSYIILGFLGIINIVLFLLVLVDNDHKQDLSIEFFASGNSQNMSCLSVYINDSGTDHEYSFDNGQNWQKSKYGAIYQNGLTSVLVRDKNNNTIYENELNIDYLVSDGPIINIDFDGSINNINEKGLLKGVKASMNGEDLLSKVEANIVENHIKNVLVSYLIEENDKKCYLLRDTAVGSSTTDSLDEWVWPTQKPYKFSKVYGKYNGKMHNGVDIYGLKRSSPIYAARAGTVVAITSNASSGYYVTIKHDNGYYTRYAHMQNTNGNDKLNKTSSATKYINVGDRVEAGDIIGEIGSSGNSTGLHLHFEIWDGKPYASKSYDPLKFY